MKGSQLPKPILDKISLMWKVIDKQVFFVSPLDDRFVPFNFDNTNDFVSIYKIEPITSIFDVFFDLKLKNKFFNFYALRYKEDAKISESDLYGFVIIPNKGSKFIFRATNRGIIFTNEQMTYNVTSRSKIEVEYNDNFLTVLRIGFAYMITDLTKLLNIM